MKKMLYLTAALIASMSAAATTTYAKNVSYPGFHDGFTVTLGAGVDTEISYIGQEGTVYNDPDTSKLFCSGSMCHFTLTDDDSWDSSGNVTYLIGDQTKQGPYCVVTLNDGALIPEASLTSQCANGASPTELLHNDNEYQFSINKVS